MNRLAAKFVYFYKPYSFDISTSRYMTFDGEVDEAKLKHIYELEETEKYLASREVNEDEWGDVKRHVRKTLKPEIFEAKCRLAENEGK